MSMEHKSGYILLLSSDEWYQKLSPAELQKVIDDAKTWIDRLVAQGKAKGGHALVRRGAIISGKSRRLVSDGPFAESKEAIGGTLLLDVATLEEAIAIAETSPTLRYNTTIEVRPVSDECPLNVCLREKQKKERPTGGHEPSH